MYISGQNLFKDLDIVHGVGGGRGVEVHDVTYRHLAYLAPTYLFFTYLTLTYRTFTYLTFSYLSLTHLDQGEVADKENIVDRQLDMTWG